MRKGNGLALRKVCARFVEFCREIDLLARVSLAIHGSKFKAVNNWDKTFIKSEDGMRPAGGERCPLDPTGSA